MCRKLIKGSGDGFIEKRSKSDTINDLIVELGRDGLDDNSVYTLIKGLRKEYPGNNAIIKLSETLGFEPNAYSHDIRPKSQSKKKTLANEGQISKGDGAKYNQTRHEKAIGDSDSGDRKSVENMEECVSTDFYRTVYKMANNIKNNAGGN